MHKFDIKKVAKLDSPERRAMMPADSTLDKFKIEDDGDLLDLGCGVGYFSIPAAKLLKNHKVIGVDIMSEMIEIAKERAEDITNIEFRRGGEYSFPVEDNSVKYIFISNVIHEVEDRTKYFNEIKRVSEKEAYLCIIDWQKKETKMGPPLDDRVSEEEIKELCSSIGFKFIDKINMTENHYGLKFKLV
jgi:ubiquinone/menaquinone biosynthesis C-methylase UbiE